MTKWAVLRKLEVKVTVEIARGVFVLGCSKDRLRGQKFASAYR